ncbi:putative metal-binding motif-containing protein [Arenimonas sp.]|uniref:putative metal-binding motif-containing protein n=1 Tax=Arenimonas sp. TaxID=1872635 RepID=UPI0035AE677F
MILSMPRFLLAGLLAAACVSAVAAERETVRVRVGDGSGAVVRPAIVKCSSDAQCDDGVYCNGAERCAPTDPRAARSGCVAGAPPCRLGEDCLEAEDRCRLGSCDRPDADGDGHAAAACGGNDCDDFDANRNPSRTEICDAEGIDEDCDPITVGDRDADGDGYIDAMCR